MAPIVIINTTDRMRYPFAPVVRTTTAFSEAEVFSDDVVITNISKFTVSMPLKAGATVRMVNVDACVQKSELSEFLTNHGLRSVLHLSLCPSSSGHDAMQVATITLRTPSEAKRSLALTGTVLRRFKIAVDIDFMGLTVLAAPKEPQLDIIALHGLNGHAFETWVYHNDGQPDKEAMWLRDFLPGNTPSARIMVYGYNSALVGSNTSVSGIKDFAYDLLQRILDDRTTDKAKRRPIVFICHSLGGIVVKQALILAHAERCRYPCLWDATYSVLFLATPHGGSKSTDLAVLLSNIASLAFQKPAKQLLDTLRLDSSTLCKLAVDFHALPSEINIVSFYERRKTPVLNSLVVDEQSSLLGHKDERLIPIDATHSGICKFSGPSHSLFAPVLAQVKRCCQDSPSIIKARFDDRRLPAMARHHSVSGGHHFIVPQAKNPYFSGRESELALLDKYLTEADYDACSTYPIVAVHGLGGVGKTQLITEYVYTRKMKKPNASVFWVTATSEESIDLQFRQIAEQLLKTSVSADESEHTKQNAQSSKRGVPHGQDAVGNVANLEAATYSGLRYVQNWMLAPGHEDWLLILDNLDDIQINVRRLLPLGAAGSVVITTRDRRVIGSIATSVILLNAMESPDAERLLLRLQKWNSSLDWGNPESHPEYDAIQLIVQELNGFPLAIAQAAAFIRENTPMQFQEYLNFLKPRSEDRELLMRFKEANPDYPESVMTTWEISLRYLERTQSRASKILQLLGFFNHSQIAESLLTSVTKDTIWRYASRYEKRRLSTKLQTELAYLKHDVGFRTAIGALTSLSLVKRDLVRHLGPVLSVNPLVHEWSRVRLNSSPAQQANYSISATLILYQSFPLDLITRVYDEPLEDSKGMYSRVDQVMLQLKSVLLNLRDYHAYADSSPIECFILCGTLLLASYEKHSIYHRPIDKSMVTDIRQTMTMIESQIEPRCRPIHSIISTALANLYLSSSSLHAKSRVYEVLKSVTLVDALEDCDASLLMLLVTVINDISNRASKTQQSLYDLVGAAHKVKDVRSSSNVQQSNKVIIPPDVKHRELDVQVFSELHRVLASAPHVSAFVRQVSLYVDICLVKLMTPYEYHACSGLSLVDILSSASLAHLHCNEKAAYICLGAKLLLEDTRYWDFDGLRRIFSLAMRECLVTLKELQEEREKDQAKLTVARWSHSGYISSSFGRADSTIDSSKTPRYLLSVFGSFDYIWSTTFRVAEAISDPKSLWKLSGQSGSYHGALNRTQRQYAPRLINRARTVFAYVKARGFQHQIIYLETTYLPILDDRQGLIGIFTHLEDWPAVSGLVQEMLQCKKIVNSYNETRHKPWELEEAKSDIGNHSEPGEPRLDAREVNKQSSKSHAAWLPFLRRSRRQGQSQLEPVKQNSMSADQMRASPALNSDEQRQWESIFTARLDKAAGQLLSRKVKMLPVTTKSDPNSILAQLQLPDSCRCLTYDNVDSTIASFITLVEKQCRLPSDQVQVFEAKLSAVKGIEGLAPKHLGRLELIFQLSCILLDWLAKAEDQENRGCLVRRPSKIFEDYGAFSDSDDSEQEEGNDAEESDGESSSDQSTGHLASEMIAGQRTASGSSRVSEECLWEDRFWG